MPAHSCYGVTGSLPGPASQLDRFLEAPYNEEDFRGLTS
jgi:hypothetical protein